MSLRESKGDLVNAAFSKMGISGITAPPDATDIELSLLRLESLMHELEETRNICIGYNFTDEPSTNNDHGIPKGAFEAISALLAVRTLSDFAMPAPPGLEAQVNSSMSALSGQTIQLRETQYPNRMPRGSGNTLRFNRWQRFNREAERSPPNCTTHRMNVGEINDFVEDYSAYLNSGETISSFTLTVTSGLRLVSSSNSNTAVSYRLEALTPGAGSPFEEATFNITTSTGRKERRVIAVNVTEANVREPYYS